MNNIIPSSSPSSSSSSFWLPEEYEMEDSYPLSPLSLLHRIKDSFHVAVSSLFSNLFSALFTFFFALVGTLLGALTGALIGQETESGFIRGAAVGAISGAVFSIEVFESSLLLWQSDESGIGCLLYLIDVLASLLSGRLVRERIGPAMLSAVQSQMEAVDSHFQEEQTFLTLPFQRVSLGTLSTGSQRFESQTPLGRWSLALSAFRTFRWERQLEVCRSAIICSTYHASTNGFSSMLLARYAEDILNSININSLSILLLCT